MMWAFYIMAGLLTGGIVVKIIYPLARGGEKKTAAAVMVFLPLVSLALYLGLGRPELRGHYRVFEDAGSMLSEHYALLARRPMEMLAEGSPDDIGALASLAQIDVRLKHYPEAITLFRRAVEVSKAQEDVRHRSLAEALGEVQVEANGGVVGDDAVKTFEYILTLHAENPIARYYLAMRKAQNGQKQEALDEWRVLLNDGYPTVWWKKRLRESIMQVREELKAGAPEAKP